LALLLLSPILLVRLLHLRAFSGVPTEAWTIAGSLGEAYGAASAILSAIALLGVVGSLWYQARQNRMQQQQFVRSLQFDLFRMSIEDPTLRHAYGGFSMSLSPQEWRLVSFANMRLIYVRMGFDHGNFSELDTRMAMRTLFESEGGILLRQSLTKDPWYSTGNPRGNQFLKILRSEVERSSKQTREPLQAISQPNESVVNESLPTAPAKPSLWSRCGKALVLLSALIAVLHFLRRTNRVG
jgi:hypothetical protein